MDDKLIIKMYTEIFLTTMRSSAQSWHNSVVLMSDMAETWKKLSGTSPVGEDEISRLEDLSKEAQDSCKVLKERTFQYMEYYMTPREPSSYLSMIDEVRGLNESMIEAGDRFIEWYQKLSIIFFNL